MCAPDCRKGRAAEEHTGGPGCTSGWDCAGRCAPLLQGGTYSPGKKSSIIFTINLQKELRDWNAVCQGWLELFFFFLKIGAYLTIGRIQRWQVSKQRKGQSVTQQNHISMTNCLPAVQMASMRQPSSTCCLLEMLPLCLQETKKICPGAEQGRQILLKRLVHGGDRLGYLKMWN